MAFDANRLWTRQPMWRANILKALFACLCICEMCGADCGENPLDQVQRFGWKMNKFLDLLKLHKPNEHVRLMQLYREYEDCVRAVHTGYYKRSDDTLDAPKSPTLDKVGRGQPFVVASLGDVVDMGLRELLVPGSAKSNAYSWGDQATLSFRTQLAKDYLLYNTPENQINDMSLFVKRLLPNGYNGNFGSEARLLDGTDDTDL
ncbi:uncharacterized protein LOC128231067 [Mya arenaria]|uniref:uncharacterized protein LOC128231067 n=1 Tax=Mya arenaria TaxID=6604 RepID=UPI0022E976DB|nr:uncharacterized protein LOC128231067 [Mya arenaria]